MKSLSLGAAVVAATLITAATAQAEVRLYRVNPNPTGVHQTANQKLNAEWIEVRNSGSRAKALTGWTLRGAAGHVFRFPAFSLCGGCVVRIRTGTGADTARALFWGRPAQAWGDSKDTATLRKKSGTVADSCRYPGPGVPPPPGSAFHC